ncbi:MAG: response regulator transcription factor [Halopseudomonas sp.]
MRHNIRLVLVDDHPMFREGVALTLGAEVDMKVVGQGCNVDDALHLVKKKSPDLVLLDILMDGGGLNAAKQIGSQHPSCKVVMLTSSEEEEDVLEALNIGARGYILKGIAGPELVRIIRSIEAGESYVNPALAANLLGCASTSNTSTRGGQSGHLSDLTERELETLKLVSKGLSNKEVARELCLSDKTIKSYMTSILQKLNVRNRVEASMLVRMQQK